MRTTVDLDDALMKRAKRHVVEEGISLKEFIAEAIEKSLSEEKKAIRMDKPPVRSMGRQIPALTNREISEIFMEEESRKLR